MQQSTPSKINIHWSQVQPIVQFMSQLIMAGAAREFVIEQTYHMVFAQEDGKQRVGSFKDAQFYQEVAELTLYATRLAYSEIKDNDPTAKEEN